MRDLQEWQWIQSIVATVFINQSQEKKIAYKKENEVTALTN